MKLGLCASAYVVLSMLAPVRGQAETLIRLNLPKDYSRLAVREMQAELDRIVVDAELGLRWAPSSSNVRTVNGPTVSVSLLGSCTGRAPRAPESGPLGWTKSIDDRVLPYVEISCGRVETVLEPAWRGESAAQRELFFGRALARVLAHELAHALTRTTHHSTEGLRKPALSASDLTTGTYRMASADFERPRPEPRIVAAYGPSSASETAAAVDGGGR